MDLDTSIMNLIKKNPMTAMDIFNTIKTDEDIVKTRIDVRLSYLRKWNLVTYNKIVSKKQGRNPLIYTLSEKGREIL